MFSEKAGKTARGNDNIVSDQCAQVADSQNPIRFIKEHSASLRVVDLDSTILLTAILFIMFLPLSINPISILMAQYAP